MPFRICIKVLLNPHRGVTLLPFIKTITLCLFISVFSLSSRLPAVFSTGAHFRLCDLILEEIWEASAPSILSIWTPFLNIITVGTESTWKYIYFVNNTESIYAFILYKYIFQIFIYSIISHFSFKMVIVIRYNQSMLAFSSQYIFIHLNQPD